MTFNLSIPKLNDDVLTVPLNVGESLIILGPNGAGKSALMHRFYSANMQNARRISAHRQTWFSSNAITLSPDSKRQTESSIRTKDTRPQARWRDDYSDQRASIALYDLIEAENTRAHSIAQAVDGNDIGLARERSKKQAPIKIMNELLRLSNIPIEISVREHEHILASKSGGAPYSIVELSDGERNAILLAANVLTVGTGSLILVDEPERHLHRSIISPLLTLLFANRPDCAFVISTHDVLFPLDNPHASILLLRDCTFAGPTVATWDAELILPSTEIDAELKEDILGARRKLLFVEGTEQSLDKPLYSLIFPNVSVIAKSTSRYVENAVSGIRDAHDLHWVHAFGIVDNDRRTQDDIDRLRERGIYAVSVFSVESIYYHPYIQNRVAQRHANLTGEDASALVTEASGATIAAVRPHVQRLSERVAEKAIREQVLKSLPGREAVSQAAPINISIDIPSLVSEERERLNNALDSLDLLAVIARYPIRETPALGVIANRLGFQNRDQYERAVRKLLIDDCESVAFVRDLFGSLYQDINVA